MLAPNMRAPVNCPMDMSPASIACRARNSGRPIYAPRPAPVPAPAYFPEAGYFPYDGIGAEITPYDGPSIQPVRERPVVSLPVYDGPILHEEVKPIRGGPVTRLPPFRRPAPAPADDCPPFPITCSQGMDPRSIACREKARRCASKRPFPIRGRGKAAKGKCGKTRKQGCECSDDEMEMEGGFVGALARGIGSLAARFGARGATAAARGATTAARGATTAARSTAIVPYSAATAARNLAAARGATAAAARGTTATSRLAGLRNTLGAVGRTLKPLATVTSLGLPIGLSVYQAIDYEQTKAAQEAADAEADRLDEITRRENADLAAQDRDILKTQQDTAKAEYEALMEQRKRDEAEYNKLVKQQEEEYLRRVAEEERQQQILEEELRAQLAEQKKFMEDQIKAEIAMLIARQSRPAPPPPAPPPRGGPTTQPPPRGGPTTQPPPQQPPPTSGRLPRRGGAMVGGARAKRAEIVRRVMKQKGLSLPQASKYVKENGLYKK